MQKFSSKDEGRLPYARSPIREIMDMSRYDFLLDRKEERFTPSSTTDKTNAKKAFEMIPAPCTKRRVRQSPSINPIVLTASEWNAGPPPHKPQCCSNTCGGTSTIVQQEEASSARPNKTAMAAAAAAADAASNPIIGDYPTPPAEERACAKMRVSSPDTGHFSSKALQDLVFTKYPGEAGTPPPVFTSYKKIPGNNNRSSKALHDLVFTEEPTTLDTHYRDQRLAKMEKMKK